jgi:hypothetical protein
VACGDGGKKKNNGDSAPDVPPSTIVVTPSSDSLAHVASWDNPSAMRVMLVRFPENAPEATPTPGVAYNVGSPIGTGNIVYLGEETTFNDTDVDLCLVSVYRLWWQLEPGLWSDTWLELTTSELAVPDVATNVIGSGSVNGVSLTWEDPTSTNFDSSKIVRKAGLQPANLTDGETVYEGSDGQFSDDMVPGGGDWGYQIFSCNRCGTCEETGVGVLVLNVPVLDIVPPDDVTDVSLVAGDSEIFLSWRNPITADLDGTRILRKSTGAITDPNDGGASVVCDDSNDSAPPCDPLGTLDTGLTNSVVYHYTIFAVDMVGNFSTGVADFATPVPDTFPPGNVAGLSATPGDGTVTLRWQNPGDRDFNKVRILRSGADDITGPNDDTLGSATLLCDPCTTGHVDSSVTNGTTYYYMAFAVDFKNNWSSGSKQDVVPGPLPMVAVDAPAGASGYGNTVAIYSDINGVHDDYLAVGAPGEDNSQGAVYIYRRTAANTWGEMVRLKAITPTDGDQFGISVAIDRNDSTGDYYLAVGANQWDDPVVSGSGTAYIYRLTAPGTWGEEQKLVSSTPSSGAHYGESIAIDEDHVIIGEPDWDRQGSPKWGSVGRAFIYHRSATNTWDDEVTLEAFDQFAGDRFGQDVDISGSFAIVGAFNQDGGALDSQGDSIPVVQNVGAAYIFENSATNTWDQGDGVAKLTPPNSDILLGSPPEALGHHAQFGFSVGIDGDYAVVGARQWGDNLPGAGFVFHRLGTPSNNVWDKGVQLSDGLLDGFSMMGWSCDISGDTVVVGAANRDVDPDNTAGSIHLYSRTGDVSTPNQWNKEIVITHPTPQGSGKLGHAAAIHGAYAIFGSDMSPGNVLSWELQ